MLGIVALIFIIILSVKLFLNMNRHYPAMVNNAIHPAKARVIQVAPLLYIPGVITLMLSISRLMLAPIPIGFLLLLPGILLGRKYSKLLECSGTDVGVEAGRTVANIMWLGIGAGVFSAANLLLTLIIY